jgi:glycosyltransferase involved in cell wall biosynthesis
MDDGFRLASVDHLKYTYYWENIRESNEMSALPISVQICTLNEEKNIEDVICAVKKNNPREIIVIDGNSNDSTVIKARKHGVKVINAGRIGLAGQRQKGLEATCEPFVAFIDADDRPEKNFLQTLLSELEAFSLDAIDGITKPEKLETYWQRGWSNSIYEKNDSVKMTNMIGRPAIYKKESLLEIGFDKSMQHWAEDTDLSYGFELKGKKQGRGTGVSYRIHEKKFIPSIKKWFSYGKGYARFANKYPEKRNRMIWHVMLNLGILRPLKKLPDSIIYVPFYFFYGFFSTIGFSFESIRLFKSKYNFRRG